MPLPLVTERLRLRPATLDDLDVWLALSRDAEELWWGEAHSNLDDARKKLEWHMANQERYGFASWAVELRATGKVIGAAGLGHLADSDEIEVSYRLLKEHWGKGYATEAAGVAIAHGFDELGFDRIVAVTLPTNTASRRVLEKCGMSFVGITTHHGEPHVKYAIAR
jgi:[ribosomal protein S5]-alanine N-acetyltransferase